MRSTKKPRLTPPPSPLPISLGPSPAPHSTRPGLGPYFYLPVSRTTPEPMADVIDYRIHGDDMQLVEIELDPGEGVRAEAGAMLYTTDGIRMQTGTEGGIFRGLKRMVTGESFFITSFVYDGSAVIEKVLEPGETLRVDTGCLVAFAPSVDYDVEFVGGFKNALFGGEGLFLTTLRGPGLVFLQSLPFSRLADRLAATIRSASRMYSNKGET